jgi:hypothetical protein
MVGQIYYDKITKVADAVSTINNNKQQKTTTKVEEKDTGCIRGSQTGTQMEILASFCHNKHPLYLVEKGILIFKHILM